MRARYPDHEGYAEHEGVKVFYEVFGVGDPTIVFLHGWQIGHSRLWKNQVPYLARHSRVITFDFPGNGGSDRPGEQSAAYDILEWPSFLHAVLDATATDRAVLVGLSGGAIAAISAAGIFPERVEAVVATGHPLGVEPPYVGDWALHFNDPVDDPESGAWNRASVLADYPAFLRSFNAACFCEPHSTKAVEDAVGYGLETTPEAVVPQLASFRPDTIPALAEEFAGLCEQVRCPVLFIHGSNDAIAPPDGARTVADRLGAEWVLIEGGGHIIGGRDPVRFNLLVKDFVDRVHTRAPRPRTWRRARARPKRALYLSSPIGLGHALRDVAISGELRALHPDLEVDWLTQHPVTALLEAKGERVHPASAHLANESSHIESESAEHDLHCFQAYRRMDEILCANFMVLHDVLEAEHYDLVVGDEAWDLDYYWHNNPEVKSAAYVWLTDFVGFLPLPDGGPEDAFLTADYNAEKIELIERYPRIRDRAIFVGNRDDIVPERFGEGLPVIREWTEAHFDFAGYVTGFDPQQLDREAIRAELGWDDDEQVCVVAVGGSGVGVHLLRRLVAAQAESARLVPGLRMVVVTGPRIDPASFPERPGLEAVGYVPDLYRHFAACDLAVVQGGLTTCMELTANRRPFLYVPLRHHFEQQIHVRHRLDRYGAGRRVDYDDATPDALAEAIAVEIGRPVDYLPVETDGAARAAAGIAELL
jgi:pimeloyl-ACP methyl ester carboxylesterase/predicted glycosyltransferase